ncbi:P-loop containing nucleoside triphosphate hydrolase protein [Cristinia sonorae]|uniref:P-loop containing nucleoside triphosphate hydrolase protein n=1 Tax=Cristinia sonorae TaxID=1940300 RepID=A0A8K0UID6_9AGAR|nr:P-loop containing nucleoside triphosphate hydrolase protein [Cristinia sonorae]
MQMGMNEKSAVGIASSEYARRTARLISLVTDLRSIGGGKHLDLPRIAVIGNQSAGKSSVVEAISGITVPRASGTCTRCPMECRLKYQTESWSCQIRIRREQSDGDNVSGNKDNEEPFGPLITDKTVLEEMIRRAQLAVLTPDVQPSFFETFDTSSLEPNRLPPGASSQLQFSFDVVCLDIGGPDLTDLSFIDLPGIISYDNEDRGNIDIVKNMVKRHISNDNTLILLTITMRDDINNQGAVDLARLADPTGSRTLGVLTKADLVQRGEYASWFRIIDGKDHPLKLGYFVTKQQSPEELEEGITFDAARLREATFFDNAPWNGRRDLRVRYGTPNLTKELSKLLGVLINKALPGLREDCKEALRVVNEDIDKLPSPPSDQPASELLRLVTAFSGDVERLVRGTDNFEYLLQKCRPAYRTFKHHVRSTCPDLRPFSDASVEPHDDTAAQQQFDAGVGLEPMSEGWSPFAAPMYLNDVRVHIDQSLTRELPYNVPFKAKVSLIRKFSEPWIDFSSNCLASIHEVSSDALHQLVHTHFGKFAMTGLLDMIQAIVETQIEKSRSNTQERLKWMLKLEDPPFTMNDHYFSLYREKYLTKYKEARKISPATVDETQIQAALSALTTIGHQGVKVEDLAKLHGNDPYEEELIVMAETAAYFHVSFKRLIDNIPRIIDYDFLHAIMKEIQGRLIGELDIGGEGAKERAAAYFAEDEQVGIDRKSLKSRKESLDAVQRKLWNFAG